VAPEIISNKAYGQQCDYWSLAVVLFIMLSGTPPFYHEDNFELFELIKKGDYDKEFAGNGWGDVSPEAKDFIKQLLVVDPDQRMTSEGIKSHDWFNGNFKSTGKDINVLAKMKEYNTQRKLLLQ
jgi:serine/threonine protein kinase